jgi:hypothetical protein
MSNEEARMAFLMSSRSLAAFIIFLMVTSPVVFVHRALISAEHGLPIPP